MDKILNTGYYGKNIQSVTTYNVIGEKLKSKVQHILFYGHLAESDNQVLMSLLVIFKDGSKKEYPCELNSEGNYNVDAYEKALKQADDDLDYIN